MKPKISTNNLMKNFMPITESELPTNNDTNNVAAHLPVEQVATDFIQEESSSDVALVLNEKKKVKVKEKQIPITFNIPTSLNDRLMTYVYKRKLEGMKITKTEVIAKAIENFLNEAE